MKYTCTFLFFFLTLIGLSGQKQVVCKSGQVIEVDGASNFLASNLESLLAKQTTLTPEIMLKYKSLLEKEKRNRLELLKLERLVAILQYDLERAEKDKRDFYKVKMQTARKDIKECNKQYEELSRNIKDCLTGKKEKSTEISVPAEPVTDSLIAVTAKDPVRELPEKVEDATKQNQKTTEVPKDLSEEMREVAAKQKKDDGFCAVMFKGRDPNTGKKQVVLYPSTLFTFTPEKMKNYFKTRDFMTLSLGLEKLDGAFIFNVEVNFNSRDVMRSYGVIHKSDFLRLEFISGKRVFFKVVDVSEPYLEKETGNTIYEVKYTLNNKQDTGLLRNEYLNSLGIMWSSGFESYPVYDVDFFHRQIKCLNHD
ncbi:MAG: hypothetical protein IPN29_08995 [Saprospiraceae bacterium]|nr:hypothetical protein [Saprospiraceae bacterium]